MHPVLVNAIRRHFPRLDEGDCVDASVDAWLDYLKDPARFRPGDMQLSSFLYVLAERNAMDALRRRRARRAHDHVSLQDQDGTLSAGGDGPYNRVLGQEVLTLILREMAGDVERLCIRELIARECPGGENVDDGSTGVLRIPKAARDRLSKRKWRILEKHGLAPPGRRGGGTEETGG